MTGEKVFRQFQDTGEGIKSLASVESADVVDEAEREDTDSSRRGCLAGACFAEASEEFKQLDRQVPEIQLPKIAGDRSRYADGGGMLARDGQAGQEEVRRKMCPLWAPVALLAAGTREMPTAVRRPWWKKRA